MTTVQRLVHYPHLQSPPLCMALCTHPHTSHVHQHTAQSIACTLPMIVHCHQISTILHHQAHTLSHIDTCHMTTTFYMGTGCLSVSYAPIFRTNQAHVFYLLCVAWVTMCCLGYKLSPGRVVCIHNLSCIHKLANKTGFSFKS